VALGRRSAGGLAFADDEIGARAMADLLEDGRRGRGEEADGNAGLAPPCLGDLGNDGS
jgi:hypothetical protein